MPQGERVLEVQDGEDEADELAQRHDEGDGEGGAFCGEDEDAPDAHVPGGAGLRRFSVNSQRLAGEPSGQVHGFNVHIPGTRKQGVGHGCPEAPPWENTLQNSCPATRFVDPNLKLPENFL